MKHPRYNHIELDAETFDAIEKVKYSNPAKALEQLKFKFSSGKAFKPSNRDFHSLNGLITYVNKTKAQYLAQNPLFAKLLIVYYMHLLKHYNCTPFDQAPQLHLQRLFSKSMDLIIYEFWQELNFDELGRRLGPLSVSGNKHPAMETPEEKQAFLDNFDNLPEEEKARFWKKDFDIETVTEILNKIVVQILENHD